MAPTEREEGLVESEVLLGKEGWLLLAQQYTRQFEFEFVDRHLPWLVYYQQEPALLKQDLQHFGLYLEILFVSIWFLGRASRRGHSNRAGRGRRKQQHNQQQQQQQHNQQLHASEWQSRRFYLKRSVSTGRVSLDDEATKTPAWNSAKVEKQDSFSDQTVVTTDDEEECFEQYYHEVIGHSHYRRLVLPPQCRYVGRNAIGGAATAGAGATKPHQTTTANRSDETNHITHVDNAPTKPNFTALLTGAKQDDIEDNPVGRIQYYKQQLWTLIRTILSFDYIGVAWMLWTWAQNFRRRHTKQGDMADCNDNGNVSHGDGPVLVADPFPAHPAAASVIDATEVSNSADAERAETLPTLDEEEHETLSSIAGDDENDYVYDNNKSDDKNRARYSSPVNMTGDQHHDRTDDSDGEVTVSPFVRPRQEEQTPVPEKQERSDAGILRSQAPMIPPITTKQLLQHGMARQQQQQQQRRSHSESAGDPSNESDEGSVLFSLSATSDSGPKLSIGPAIMEASSSSKRSATKVLPSRSWLFPRNYPSSCPSDIDANGLDGTDVVPADLSDVDTDFDETASYGHSPLTSPLRYSRPQPGRDTSTILSQELLPRLKTLSPPLLTGSANFEPSDPLPSTTANAMNSPAHDVDPFPRRENHVPPVLAPDATVSAKSSLRHFFDTASSRESLKKMSVEITTPDKHGYVLGDDFLPDGGRSSPLLVFVNARSGPQQGHLLIAQLRRLLNPIQVWDLSSDGSPETILESFLILSRLRILVCGGDGTVSWIIHMLEKMQLPHKLWPPIAVLPLGTGNDLARIHGWGGGYNSSESLITILEQICESYASLLDR